MASSKTNEIALSKLFHTYQMTEFCQSVNKNSQILHQVYLLVNIFILYRWKWSDLKCHLFTIS